MGTTPSRSAGTPGSLCGMKLVTPICDGAETVDVNPELPSVTLPPGPAGSRHEPPGPPGPPYEKRFHQVVISTQSIPFEEELTTVRLGIAAEYARVNGIDTVENPESDGPLGIVATGKSYADIIQALRLLNLEGRVPVLKLGVIYPVNPRTIREFAGRLKTVVVVEEKGPFVEEAVAHALLGTGVAHVYGKRGPDDRPLIPAYGELNPDLLTQLLGPMLQEIFPSAPIYDRMEELNAIAERDPGSFARRTAHYCPGCPTAYRPARRRGRSRAAKSAALRWTPTSRRTAGACGGYPPWAWAAPSTTACFPLTETATCSRTLATAPCSTAA